MMSLTHRARSAPLVALATVLTVVLMAVPAAAEDGVTVFRPDGASAIGVEPAVGAIDLVAVPDGGDHDLWVVAVDGTVHAHGVAEHFGNAPDSFDGEVAGISATSTGEGYWLVASDGSVFAFGDAPFLGDMSEVSLNLPIVGMAATATGEGYWLVASDGGIFAFGDAGFHGSTGAIALNQPIVGMAATATGEGYWLVASDGGIFAFGDAGFHGSTGAIALNQPIVGMAPTASGIGYWLIAVDGGVFAFGDAPFLGSGVDLDLSGPVTGVTRWGDGDGYALAVDGAADVQADELDPYEEFVAGLPQWLLDTYDRLAFCESGGNWAINTGNGYYGGIQFSVRSWRWVGGEGYPHQASKAEQIYRAEILRERQGWNAWPACSRKLGLR